MSIGVHHERKADSSRRPKHLPNSSGVTATGEKRRRGLRVKEAEPLGQLVGNEMRKLTSFTQHEELDVR